MSRLSLPLMGTRIQRFGVPTFIGVFVLVSVVAFVRVASRVGDSNGSVDLQSYWYYGHFLRAGMNPYIAYAQHFSFSGIGGTLYYVDGSVATPDDVPLLARVPANTAPVLILMSTLTYLPWEQAKIVWMLCNFAFLIAIPWLVLRLLPPQLQLPSSLQWLAAFTFYASKVSRESAAYGQTTLLVFFLMVATLLLRRSHWFWAGLALGVALSKYSMSLPVFVFLLLERRFRVAAVAVLVQGVGLITVAALGNASIYNSLWDALFATFMVHWRMLAIHSIQDGVYFGDIFRAFPQLVLVLNVVVILGTVFAIGNSWLRGWLASDVLPVNTLMILGILLVVYHRYYDTVMAIMFLVLCLSVIVHWQLPIEQKVLLGLLYLLVVVVIALPSEIQRGFMTPAQADAYIDWRDGAIMVVVAVMWFVNLYLLRRTPRVSCSHLMTD